MASDIRLRVRVCVCRQDKKKEKAAAGPDLDKEAKIKAQKEAELAARAKALGCVAVHCDRRQPLLQPGSAPAVADVDGALRQVPADRFAAVMHGAGLAVHVYTVNEEAEGRRLLDECRVDALFSDGALPGISRGQQTVDHARLAGVSLSRASSCMSFASMPGTGAATLPPAPAAPVLPLPALQRLAACHRNASSPSLVSVASS